MSQDIIFIGKQWERKRGPLLLEAFERLKHKYPSARLHIIGCSPEIPHHNKDIYLHGYLNPSIPIEKQKLEKLLQDSRIFCMPSS